MNITKEKYERIAQYFPRQRGNVKIDNFTFISAILYMDEYGCKWRALPEKFGNWNSVYKRFERWAENGVMQEYLQLCKPNKSSQSRLKFLRSTAHRVKSIPTPMVR